MSLAVLCSGGLDSAILLGDALLQGTMVHPLYIRCGLFWESVELAYLRRFLSAVERPALRPLVVLDQPVRDLYGDHWSITGRGVPTANDPDERAFLPGRNVLLLAKALLWCHLNQVPAVALGTLPTNPFPDATPSFFRAMGSCVDGAVGGQVEVLLPFFGRTKTAVMHLGRVLPLEHTFSCLQPNGDSHCGRCNKCGERREAFRAAGLHDPTFYAASDRKC